MRTIHVMRLGAALALATLSDARGGAVTNSIPRELLDPRAIWGGETNGLCSAILCGDVARRHSRFQEIHVEVVTASTNALYFHYVAPPGGRPDQRKLRAIELRGPDGQLIVPRPRKSLVATLPETVLARDLAKEPRRPSGFRDTLLMPVGIPLELARFVIQEHYDLEVDGEYRLKIWPALYEFDARHTKAIRVDLPPVTAKIHLTPSRTYDPQESHGN